MQPHYTARQLAEPYYWPGSGHRRQCLAEALSSQPKELVPTPRRKGAVSSSTLSRWVFHNNGGNVCSRRLVWKCRSSRHLTTTSPLFLRQPLGSSLGRLPQPLQEALPLPPANYYSILPLPSIPGLAKTLCVPSPARTTRAQPKDHLRGDGKVNPGQGPLWKHA